VRQSALLCQRSFLRALVEAGQLPVAWFAQDAETLADGATELQDACSLLSYSGRSMFATFDGVGVEEARRVFSSIRHEAPESADLSGWFAAKYAGASRSGGAAGGSRRSSAFFRKLTLASHRSWGDRFFTFERASLVLKQYADHTKAQLESELCVVSTEDVPNRTGKRQYRFNVVVHPHGSPDSERFSLELAARTAAQKVEWAEHIAAAVAATADCS
jgi:hypothetical protein